MRLNDFLYWVKSAVEGNFIVCSILWLKGLWLDTILKFKIEIPLRV